MNIYFPGSDDGTDRKGLEFSVLRMIVAVPTGAGPAAAEAEANSGIGLNRRGAPTVVDGA